MSDLSKLTEEERDLRAYLVRQGHTDVVAVFDSLNDARAEIERLRASKMLPSSVPRMRRGSGCLPGWHHVRSLLRYWTQ